MQLLKEQLYVDYPRNPLPSQQVTHNTPPFSLIFTKRLIFAGKLLRNEDTFETIFAQVLYHLNQVFDIFQYDKSIPQTIHIVVTRQQPIQQVLIHISSYLLILTSATRSTSTKSFSTSSTAKVSSIVCK